MKTLIHRNRMIRYALLSSVLIFFQIQVILAAYLLPGISENADAYGVNPVSPLIMFISKDTTFDSTAVAMLKDEGYTVVTTYPSPLNTQNMIDSLNKADLVIVGRSSTSGDLAPCKTAWNGLKVPLMLMSQHSSARDKLGWFNSVNVPHLTTPGKIYGYRTQNDTIFHDVNFLSGDTMEWSEKPEDVILVDAATNGNVLVRMDSSINALLMVRFEPGIPFYEGTCDKPYAPRTYFATGLNTGGILHPLPLSAEAKKVWLAEVRRMTDTPFTPYNPSADADLTSLVIDKGNLMPEFNPGIFDYGAELPSGTTAVMVTATTGNCSAVTGNGTIDVSSGSGVATITTKAEDGIHTNIYTVNFQVATQINGTESVTIQMVPNPAHSMLEVKLGRTFLGGGITLFNMTGEKVLQKTVSAETLRLDISGLNPGVYIVTAAHKKATATQKLEIK